MFERFTQDARNIIVLAQRESRALSHNYIGSEHLLQGLILDRGIAGQALAELKVIYEAATAKIVEIIGRGNVAPSGHSPFTPRAAAILQAANEISHGAGRHLNYNRARNAADAAGARVHIAAPVAKAVTAETASGIEVNLAETAVWEPVPFEDRIEVLAG
ncbi:Clp protease N-terminal domain-containing protein [Paenarthrobacter sp. YJN-5]|uniref:Clp protease N-terminal domain-containing protein n=1 Tax=Paenarthrobacter sp. YJN-5 TaxID=2735316 RepID=UPI001877BA38|nr:Clp protease N-terminal domain-containing protein [Paenarthrobacter sp. YJN-5]QOT19556.1 hypothetical protein HMI59_23305 [Paenarthrobacter sp. YJN-5]